ncbi:Flp family type IVb pilin [Limnohabitans sp. Jir72]|uniref:Flp family type IVb pilin n=1 Tax=Limnohabitans sp. Jir72 TaxID=1977909 RepID=UPI0011B1C86D|nr:Flp family type IVb pilin [Limnohabitans sp. Jir72]
MKTLSNMSARLHAMVAAKPQKGATMIEYVLLVALIGVVVAVALPDLTTAITNKFTTIKTSIGV